VITYSRDGLDKEEAESIGGQVYNIKDIGLQEVSGRVSFYYIDNDPG
jgi:hypothetical protein